MMASRFKQGEQPLFSRNLAWGLIMLAALTAFEAFNFSTTEYGLNNLFGNHQAFGMATWATVLAIAFCGLDFAGLSRLITKADKWSREPREIWFLTGAWFLGSMMNAVMTWWAVGVALMENPALGMGNELLTRSQILTVVPLFVAALVWMTRIMLIGTIGAMGDRLLLANSSPTSKAMQTAPAVASRTRPRSRPNVDTPRQRIPPPGPSLPPSPEPPTLPERTPEYSAARPATTARASSVRSHPARPRSTARAADEARLTPRRYDRPAPTWGNPKPTPAAATTARRSPGITTEELIYVDLE